MIYVPAGGGPRDGWLPGVLDTHRIYTGRAKLSSRQGQIHHHSLPHTNTHTHTHTHTHILGERQKERQMKGKDRITEKL